MSLPRSESAITVVSGEEVEHRYEDVGHYVWQLRVARDAAVCVSTGSVFVAAVRHGNVLQ